MYDFVKCLKFLLYIEPKTLKNSVKESKSEVTNSKTDEKKKPVSVSAFFGSSPVNRNEKTKNNKVVCFLDLTFFVYFVYIYSYELYLHLFLCTFIFVEVIIVTFHVRF